MVKKNLRGISSVDYIDGLQEFYSYTVIKSIHMPHRYYEPLGRKIVDKLNIATNEIEVVFTERRCNDDERFNNLILSSINLMSDIKPKIMAYFNIMRLPFEKQCHWAELYNKLINSLNIKLDGGIDMKKLPYLQVIDYRASKDAVFVNKMRELHKKIYSLTIETPLNINISNGALLRDKSDIALLNIVEGNARIPVTKDEYEKRKYHFDVALIQLNVMSPSLMSIFVLLDIGEKSIKETLNLYDSTIRLLKKIIESDKRRFNSLT